MSGSVGLMTEVTALQIIPVEVQHTKAEQKPASDAAEEPAVTDSTAAAAED